MGDKQSVSTFFPTDDLPVEVIEKLSNRIKAILKSLELGEIYDGLADVFINESRGVFYGKWNGEEIYAEVALDGRGLATQVISVLDRLGNAVPKDVFHVIEKYKAMLFITA